VRLRPRIIITPWAPMAAILARGEVPDWLQEAAAKERPHQANRS
jgi:hypothetical protein